MIYCLQSVPRVCHCQPYQGKLFNLWILQCYKLDCVLERGPGSLDQALQVEVIGDKRLGKTEALFTETLSGTNDRVSKAFGRLSKVQSGTEYYFSCAGA